MFLKDGIVWNSRLDRNIFRKPLCLGFQTSFAGYSESRFPMKYFAASTLVVTLFLLSGCASNEPSPAMKEWARQQIAEKQRLEAAQATHAQEVARLKTENERIKAQAEADKRQVRMSAYVEENKQAILKELTQGFSQYRQDIIDHYFKGTSVYYEIDDVTARDSILYFSQFMIWKKPDETGAMARVVFGFDPVASKFVYEHASPEKSVTRAQLAGLFKETNQSSTALSPQPSVWAPDKEVVNTAYKAAIGVGAAALTTIVTDMLSGN